MKKRKIVPSSKTARSTTSTASSQRSNQRARSLASNSSNKTNILVGRKSSLTSTSKPTSCLPIPLRCVKRAQSNNKRAPRIGDANSTTFVTLESLFDLRKPIKLDYEDYFPIVGLTSDNKEPSAEEEEGGSSSESEFAFDGTEDFVDKLEPIFPEIEPRLVLPDPDIYNDDDISDENLGLTFRDTETMAEPIPSPSADASAAKSDDAGTTEEAALAPEVSLSKTAVSETANPAQSEGTVCKTPCYEGDEVIPENLGSAACDAGTVKSVLGDGCKIGEDKICESVMSSIPLTDPCVAEQMKYLQERAIIIKKEIQDFKKIAAELSEKKPLLEEDTARLRDVQAAVMAKIGELNDITRKLQKTIDLVDPSTQNFADIAGMLPYPHQPKKKATTCKKICEPQKVCEKFAFPQIDYPEDRLPKVIVCGNTEDNIPKLVFADSRPKSRGKMCVDNLLMGKISESQLMQEKLAKAQQECEKNDAVESMQRKICGLQADLRKVLKENTELSRKVSCLAKKQSRSCSPISPPPIIHRSPCLTPKRAECSPIGPQSNSSCKCGLKGVEPPFVKTPPGCNNRIPSPCNDRRSPQYPRLAGGASRTGNDCFFQNRRDMYGRNANPSCCPQRSVPPFSPTDRIDNVCTPEADKRSNACENNNTQNMDDQMCSLKAEVRVLLTELCKVEREREQLDQQQKLLECTNPCASRGYFPEFQSPGGCQSKIQHKNLDSSQCLPCNDLPDCADQQLRDLREQYARLQDDYKSKVCEVSRLRTDYETMRRETREAKEARERLEIKLIDAQDRLRVVERERDDLLGTKEQLMEQEQALLVTRQRFREAQDELDELPKIIRDQAAQLDDYRNKYLHAQQHVEEQRHQLDLMQMDNARMNENVTLEIGRVKSQFQEKLAELAPLPDILKQTQVKLQESQQLRMMAEHNCEDLSRELIGSKEKIDAMQVQINDLQREFQILQDQYASGIGNLEELEKKNGELRTENERLKNSVARLEEQCASLQKRIDEKQHEIVQLAAMLEQVREDSARQVSRTKERCEAVKRSLQAQIGDFEKQLVQCRAAANTAQKERDEIRQKMQGQIGNLSEALQQAQGRIRSLQGHVDYLKVSYSNVFRTPDQSEPAAQCEPPTPGYDSCDCNY